MLSNKNETQQSRKKSDFREFFPTMKATWGTELTENIIFTIKLYFSRAFK